MRASILVVLNFFLLLHFSFYKSTFSKSNFDLSAKSVKYSYNKDHYDYFNCEIKKTRKITTGIVNFAAYLRIPLTGCFLDIHLFYRYGTIYHTYLIDKKGIEVCEIFKKWEDRKVRYQNVLADLF